MLIYLEENSRKESSSDAGSGHIDQAPDNVSYSSSMFPVTFPPTNVSVSKLFPNATPGFASATSLASTALPLQVKK